MTKSSYCASYKYDDSSVEEMAKARKRTYKMIRVLPLAVVIDNAANRPNRSDNKSGTTLCCILEFRRGIVLVSKILESSSKPSSGPEIDRREWVEARHWRTAGDGKVGF